MSLRKRTRILLETKVGKKEVLVAMEMEMAKMTVIKIKLSFKNLGQNLKAKYQERTKTGEE